MQKDVTPSSSASAAAGVIAGVSESSLFYLFDRWKNKAKATQDTAKLLGLSKLDFQKSLVFGQDFKKRSLLQNIRYGYQGVPSYMCLKAAQKGLLFPGQRIVEACLLGADSYKSLANQLGENNAKLFTATLSGASMGVAEVAGLQWVDWLKVQKQTNPEQFKSSSSFKVMRQAGIRTLYSGSLDTLKRNLGGAGGTFLSEQIACNVLGIKDKRNCTESEKVLTSMAATFGRIGFSHCQDLSKVMEQTGVGGKKGVLYNMSAVYQKFGFSGLGKGFGQTLCGSGTKFFFAMYIFKTLEQKFSKSDRQEAEALPKVKP